MTAAGNLVAGVFRDCPNAETQPRQRQIAPHPCGSRRRPRSTNQETVVVRPCEVASVRAFAAPG
jgi:hypothetical protein